MREFSPLQQARMAFLAGRYATADEIASDHAVNCGAHDVRWFLDRMSLPPASKIDDAIYLRVSIARDLGPVLDASASARKLGRTVFSERILETVLSNALVSAVLDDGL